MLSQSYCIKTNYRIALKKSAPPVNFGRGLFHYIAESNAALIVLAGTISTRAFIFSFRFL